PQDLKVAVLNVPTVFAQVNSYSVRPTQESQGRGRYRIWLTGAASLTHRRHVVDVDTEPNHQGLSWRGTPALSRSLCSHDTGVGLHVRGTAGSWLTICRYLATSRLSSL